MSYPGDYATEADFLAGVLKKLGVCEDAIYIERKATYTYENALFSRDLVREKGIDTGKAILCCKPYHARRSLLYYQIAFPDTEFIVCPCRDSITKENWYKTEEGIDTVLGEMERIGVQFHNILRENLGKTDKM